MVWKWIESIHAKEFAAFEVRDDLTERLVAELPCEPKDFPEAVERTRKEARLIAAAPELAICLEAMLKITCGKCEGGDDRCVTPDGFDACLVAQQAKAALAKARGEK